MTAEEERRTTMEDAILPYDEQVASTSLVVDGDDNKDLVVVDETTLLGPSIQSACDLVREIVDQLTLKDAPPLNDVDELVVQNSSTSPPTAELGVASSFETESSTNNNNMHPNAEPSIIHSPSDHKLGHAPLTLLCTWTLEQVLGETTVPLQIETNVLLQQLSAPSPKTTSTSTHTKKRFSLPWKKRQQQQHESAEEKRDEGPRLHMFGSEYARHLSHSALAPPSPKKSSSTTSSLRNHRNKNKRSQSLVYLEDVMDPAIQTGAVLDICVTVGGELPPKGYYRIGQTAHGHNFVLARKNNKTLHLNIKKEPNWDKAAQRPCVTALAVIFPDQNEFVPPGFCIVRRGKNLSRRSDDNGDGSVPADLGGSERIYLCFRRSREGNPLTSILPLRPDRAERVPAGYTVVEKSPRNFGADINRGSGPPIFLAYRQRLANLETLRPLPLVASVHRQPSVLVEEEEDQDSIHSQAKRLQVYYCTGGTVVPANVGRFHIMDRSTHSLLSPSSVANRLSLIETSRRKAANKPLDLEESKTSSHNIRADDTSSTGDFDSVASTRSQLGDSIHSSRRGTLGGSSIADYPKIGEGNSSVASSEIPSFVMSSTRLFGSHEVTGGFHQSIFVTDDPEYQQCLDAMSFIPSVETATSGEERYQATVRLQARTALLTPILTACYTRHGGAALVAVEGLTMLLTKTDFFADDVDLSDESDNESSTRLTLLDLAVQVVCDVATTASLETSFAACVEFVKTAVSYSQGQLNTRTIGYAVRFYLFVYYFGASIPTKKTEWPNQSWQSLNPDSSSEVEINGDVPILFDPRGENGQGYLPGGAPQTAALSFKELISMSIVRLGKVSVNDMLVLAHSASDSGSAVSDGKQAIQDVLGPFVEGILSSLVDDAVDHVERANYTQLALHQVHRSGGSELFWHDMVNSCGIGLFGKDEKLGEAGRDIYIMIFAIMANLVKVSFGKMRNHSPSSGKMLPRDLSSKKLSLELLLYFLEYWTDEQEAVSGVTPYFGSMHSIDTLAFTIRRMVVPCLLSNTRAGLEDPNIFRRVIQIVTELWTSPVYRKNCKVELGVLMDHFALKMLQLGPQLFVSNKLDLHSDRAHISLLDQQLELLREVKNWFSGDPKDVIEVYLNYDTDIATQITGPVQLLPGTQLKIFQRLCDGLSNIAEQSGEIIANQILENQFKILSTTDKIAEHLSTSPLSSIEENDVGIDKTAVRESARLLRKASLEAILQIVKSLAVSAAAATGPKFVSLLLSWSPVDSPIAYEASSHSEEAEGIRATGGRAGKGGDGDNEVLKFWRGAMLEDLKERILGSSLGRQECVDTAVDIANKKSLKKAVEYLIGVEVITPAPRDVATFLRVHKERFDPAALGLYLGEGGVGSSEVEYWNSIRHVYVRAISFIGMNIEEGLRHFLTSCGFRLPGEAQKIDRIMNSFAQCYFEDNAGDNRLCPFKNEDTVYLLSFAIIMLNTDLHKTGSLSHKPSKKMVKADFINNLRGAEQGEDISRDYLSTIYDSIQASPIAMDEDLTGSSATDRHRLIDDMLDNVRSSDSLLRGLSVHDFRVATIEDFIAKLEYPEKDALYDLTRSCVAKTWHQWHGVINTGLEMAHLDPQGMEPSVEILMFALSITVCLDMPMERHAFLNQLGRLKAFEERRQGRWVSAPDECSFREEEWYLELEEACAASEERKLWALRDVREWMKSLHAALSVDVHNKVEMTKAVSKLRDGDFLLQDPARFLIREGDLLKKSTRTGRTTDYRFFLFSDVLLYANLDADGSYNIHEELPLHLMKVVDWYPPSQKSRQTLFNIHHPRKSFQVICSSADERKSWVEDIRAAIAGELDRKMKVEAARLAAHNQG